MQKIVDIIVDVFNNDNYIFSAGNGGSSSNASHFSNDLIKGCAVSGRNGIRSICLTDSSAVLTCLSNDYSYEDALMEYLKTMGKPGDCLALFSGSGNSKNIIKVAEYARIMGITVIGFLGGDGGALLQFCDMYILADSYDMEEIEDQHLQYIHTIKKELRKKLKKSFGMEILNSPCNTKIKYAIFDFDGTISLIRQGWQDVMIPYFVEVLSVTPKGKELEYNVLHDIVKEFVDRLTGKITLYQCIALAGWVEYFGGIVHEPIVYKQEYLRRLMEKIADRRNSLENGSNKESYLVSGVKETLRLLKRNGITLYCASGTDDRDVKYEAKLLGLEEFFGDKIYGARDDLGLVDTKEMVINEIIEKNGLFGNELIVFGDGMVEIELCKSKGGYAVAVASDEVHRDQIDEWKRKRLIEVGADMVIPFYDKRMVEYLLQGER